TGDAEADRISKAGLDGLTRFLAQRTALEAGDPVGLDPTRDELAFYPLIYWPIVPSAAKPSREALEHVDAYMKQGGTVLFDTRDALDAPPGPGGANRSPGMLALRNILSALDIPELEPVPGSHVLTKTFYLLKDFPGRFAAGQLWVEASPIENEDEPPNRPAKAGDGVSSILITSNDFAGAWATRPDGQAMLPITAGAAVIIDKSASQEFGDRTQQTEAARAILAERLGRLPGIEVRFVEAGQSDGETDGTRLFTALNSVLSDVPHDRVAGAIFVTDGRVHD